MEYSFSQEVIRDLKRIKKKHPSLYTKIKKQLVLFTENHKHPSLRTHKLKGNLSKSWSIFIAENIRMIYLWEENYAVFFKIGTPDEVYKK